MITSQQIVFADFYGRESLGAIRGASLPVYMVLQAAGPILGGFVFDQTGSYSIALIIYTVAYVLAIGCIAMAKRPLPPVIPAAPLASPAG